MTKKLTQKQEEVLGRLRDNVKCTFMTGLDGYWKMSDNEEKVTTQIHALEEKGFIKIKVNKYNERSIIMDSDEKSTGLVDKKGDSIKVGDVLDKDMKIITTLSDDIFKLYKNGILSSFQYQAIILHEKEFIRKVKRKLCGESHRNHISRELQKKTTSLCGYCPTTMNFKIIAEKRNMEIEDIKKELNIKKIYFAKCRNCEEIDKLSGY